ncbi:MAG: hypothetical protein WCP89_02370 [archaeon]
MIFDNPIFTEMILPFLLVFVLIFAILQKSKILGEGKAQIDALVGLAVGLIVIGFPVPRNIIVNLMPWMAVGVSVILVFLILYGFVAGDLSGDKVPTWMKVTFGILAGLFVIGVVMYVTGLWNYVLGGFSFGSELWMNVALIAIIVGAMIVAVTGAKK